MNKADRTIGVLVIIIGLITLGLTLSFPSASRKGIPGPALLPQLIAIALIICGAILSITAGFKKINKNVEFNRQAIKRLIGVIVLTSLSAAALPYVGFVAASAVTSFIFLLILRVRIPMAVLIAVAITVGIYAVFHYGLQVQFPTGSIW